jgi:hypothetical protein
MVCLFGFTDFVASVNLCSLPYNVFAASQVAGNYVSERRKAGVTSSVSD